MKTAGFLWGDLRTWNYIKNQSMLAYKDLYGDIDWFVAVWQSSTDTEDNIRNFFKENNLNLKFFTFVNRSSVSHPFKKFINEGYTSAGFGTLNRSYFAYILSKHKRLYEISNKIEYDRTLVTRPDILLFYNQDSIINEQYKVQSDNQLSFYLSVRGAPYYYPYFVDVGYKDTFFIFGKLSIDLWGLHYLDFNNFYNNTKNISIFKGEAHHDIIEFMQQHNLTISDSEIRRTGIPPDVYPQTVRPTMDFNRLKEDFNKWNGERFSIGKDDTWDQADLSQRRIILEEFKIDKQDYQIIYDNN